MVTHASHDMEIGASPTHQFLALSPISLRRQRDDGLVHVALAARRGRHRVRRVHQHAIGAVAAGFRVQQHAALLRVARRKFELELAVALAQEQKAERDRRYAARKARKAKKRR